MARARRRKVLEPKISEEIVPEIEVEEEVPEIEVEEEVPEPEISEEENAKLNKRADFVKRIKENAKRHTELYFKKLKDSGCDYSYNGTWQEKYANLMDKLLGLSGKSVCDIGGAFGSIAHSFKKMGTSRVVATDISKYAIEKKKFAGVEYIHAPVQYMKEIESDTFDIVHVSHVMNEIDSQDIEQSINEIKRILKPGGRAVFVHSKNIDIGKSDSVNLIEVDRKHNIGIANNYNWKCFVVTK